MSDRIKTICLILITLAILAGVAVYIWDTIEKRAYFERQERTRGGLEELLR